MRGRIAQELRDAGLLPARLLAGPAGENRSRSVEQLLLPAVNLVRVKLLLRRELGERRKRCFCATGVMAQ
jgi:hypothetical protein